MRIVNINKFFYLRGGVERYYFAQTRLLEENGHTVIPFSMQDERNFKSKYAEYFVPNIEVSRPGLKMINKAIRPIWYKEAQVQMERLIKEQKPDIAHIHMLYHHLSPSILPVLKKHKIPVVMTLHDYKLICPNYLLYTENDVCKRCRGHRYYNAIIHKCLKDSRLVSTYAALEMSIHKLMQVYEKNVDVMIAPSASVRSIMTEFHQDPGKIVVLPHFLDPSFLEQTQRVEKKADKPYLLYFGRLSREKGVDKLLEMFYIYRPNLRVKIAGDGPLKDELINYAREKGIDQQVDFLGHLSVEELESAIRGASLVIVPSQTYETFGFAALESLALGTPVVASRLGALPELIPEHLGALFIKDDLSSMAEAVKTVRQWDRSDFDKRAKQWIKGRFDAKTHYQRLMTVYDHLV